LTAYDGDLGEQRPRINDIVAFQLFFLQRSRDGDHDEAVNANDVLNDLFVISGGVFLDEGVR
jgi:hypothetical protein